MSNEPWLDLNVELGLVDSVIDQTHPWLYEAMTPVGAATEAREVNPLRTPTEPLAKHPGTSSAPDPACPVLHKDRDRMPSACGGLTGARRERATEYQKASIRDAVEAPLHRREMRSPSDVGAWGLTAHYALPRFDPVGLSPGYRDRTLRTKVLHLGLAEPSTLEAWSEKADFGINGLIRLLYLYSDVRHAPDLLKPNKTVPLLPCDLQELVCQQLLRFKYFMDEPARHPIPKEEAVYWSENHLLLYATAEYLAGQLLPDARFEPTVCWSEDGSWWQMSQAWWVMDGAERMARAKPRLIRWLDHRLMFGFSEWNSPVYYDFDIAGLLNLVDFCDDPAIADRAAMALDLLLLDLARFAGAGKAGATAGRAYTSHKLTGWGTSIANTLQILFGMWPRDPRCEEVMEDWRIDHLESVRQTALDEARRAAIEAQTRALAAMPQAAWPPPAQLAADVEASVASTMAAYDLREKIADKRQRQAPPTSSWTGAGSLGAHALATSKRYCVPEVLDAFARDPDAGWFEKSRVSIGFEEGNKDYGIGFSKGEDLVAWWSRAGFATKDTIVGSKAYALEAGVQEVKPFGDIPGMFKPIPTPIGDLPLGPGDLEKGAALLAVESEGSCLTTANLALWREEGISLSSAQKFRVGQIGRQAHLWQATLDPYVTVWSTQPAPVSSDTDGDGPSWWAGNAAQPRIVQHDDALICAHDSILFDYTSLKFGIQSHAWFPVSMFDEAFEVRPAKKRRAKVHDLHAGTSQVTKDLAINSSDGGAWWFGRRGSAYVGLYSAKSSTKLITNGRWSNREILCKDRINIFICQVGTASRFGSFPAFMEACTSARIHVGEGTYQPSNPFVDVSCIYDIPGKERLELHMENRWPRYDGKAFSDEAFHRWSNPWNDVRWRERVYSLSAPDTSGAARVLNHNCITGTRSGHGI